MSVLWHLDELIAATGGRFSAQPSRDITGVSIDTRSIEKGDLFVALKDVRDGHDFVAAALEAGAAAALVSHRPDGLAKDAPLLVVDDVLDALEGMARAARARMAGQVAAVTGSVGKTGVKEMLRHVLHQFGRVHAAERSFNNHWGVPLTLARMPRETDFAVIEIGMNAPGEIAPLSRFAQPDVAIVTTVAAVHVAAFEDVSGIAREKAEIVAGLVPGGTAVLNRDIETFPILQRRAKGVGAKIVTFGSAGRPVFHLESAQIKGATTVCTAQVHDRKLFFKLAAPGRHLAENAMAVLAAVEGLGQDVAHAALDLAQWEAPDGRGARWRVDLGEAGMDGAILLIDDAYNANPTSMGAAFEVLAAAQPRDGIGRVARGRRVLFLTDMLELGDIELTAHADLASHPTLSTIDRVHSAGPLMEALHTAMPQGKRGEWYDSAPKLAKRVAALLDAGDAVLVKGSKGSQAALIVDAIKKLGHCAPAASLEDEDEV
ncbi:UDP-N-acetylmuramoyl-tripeptide--D-alanyl-D-alanine ligase [Pontivivens insulae]|uniref:UDP-N-acetylmuramoyl-tripeptide--D-alanyl-D-alanine ligase n=1 Tax=Pontivivens insulae TaxID=1639689 RepID=A0A2R8AFM9_9RHOB|nr:UDP-N-acetylmuramoyl-tripeptide--D-alanyl-D-alanine ligase [Pontivivens insulae]RED12250.1 UDP-N-acetylmuramoyl-tripeptide--D-alanyl-D-alanine ligase [Pontivivens insulae]SPF31007.1 UDP-N-acetylmuramoyl-tripeptide--D-alanyl-D-alanine ligase [Pontivivens insulae]